MKESKHKYFIIRLVWCGGGWYLEIKDDLGACVAARGFRNRKVGLKYAIEWLADNQDLILKNAK